VQNMWMATANDGLALVAYGPNSVTAKVADGKTAKFVQETDYPFKDAVHLTYDGETASFELQLRIPEWAVAPTVTVNGEAQEGVVSGEYFTVTREWKAGDEIDLRLPSEIETSTWYNDSVAVEKGPLIFSLKIEEDWRTEESNDARDIKAAHQEQSPLREIYPASRWNYGLIVDRANPAESFEIVEQDEVALQPFSIDNAPVVLKAKGQIIPEWRLDGNLAGPQPFGPTPYNAELVEDIELIPYGSGRLRITHFPQIGEPSDTILKPADVYSKVLTVNGVTYQEFDNVVVPAAKNYTLRIAGSGAGTVIINGKYEQAIDLSSGEATIENLANLLSGDFRFKAGQYNNIRFTGDVTVDEIEVLPVKRSIDSLRVILAKRSGTSATLLTNLDPQETPFSVSYGVEGEDFTRTVTGYENGTIVLNGLDETAAYTVTVTAMIQGEAVSETRVLAPSSEEDVLKPDPNAMKASYSGFGSVEDTRRDWTIYDPEGLVEIQPAGDDGSQIHFGDGERVKAVLNIDGSDEWTDYVAEGRVTIDENKYRDVGLIFRGTKFGNNADEYQGYYAGVGKNGIVIGYADGAWHYIKTIDQKFEAGQTYTIKAVVRGSYFAIYVDDVLVHRFYDTRYAVGTVGFRSWKEAFVANGVDVRPVTEEDLKVFEDFQPDTGNGGTIYPEYVEANFSDDFEDADDSNAKWTKYGNTDRIRVENGQLHFDSNDNVKAAAGDEAWSDYVVQADITLTPGDNNAGIMYRSTNIGNGADGYNGYYFGIGNNFWTVGYANGGWNSLFSDQGNYSAGNTYTLKVIVWHDKHQFYVDDTLVREWEDTSRRYKNGKIGLRSWNRAFDGDNILVRPLTDEELADIQKPAQMNAEITSAHNTLLIDYPVVGANGYKVLYGTEPGVYAHEETNVRYSGHTRDKVAFSVPEAGSYYARIFALKDGKEIGLSDELTTVTDYIESTEKDREKLAAMLAEAKSLDPSAFTKTSLARLERAISDAEAMPENASQMDVALAVRLLYSAMNAPSSEDFTPVIPPETNKVSVRYTVNTNLTVNGEEQPLSDLIGLYTAETDETLTLTFVPAIEGRTLLSAACNGTDLSSQIDFDSETGESAFTYTAKPGDELQFTFTLVNKMILRQTVDTAEALQNGPEYEAAIGTVQTAFDNALKNAQAVYADQTASQEAVDDAWSRMLKVIHLLSFAEGSTDELESLLAIVDALNENGYTPASWAELQAAADEARALIAEPEPLKADVDKAYKALKDALMNLVEATNKETLQYYFDTASGIDLDLYLEAGKDAFRAALANAEKVLDNANATQEEVDAAASALSEAMANLLLIPNKDALKASVEKAETVDTSKYTAASVRTFQKALDNARIVLNNPQATEQQVQSADKQLTSAQNALAVKNTGKSNSKTTHTAPANTYGAEGTATVGADVAKAASVVSDTTVNFTLKRGSAYCFKMTVVNGSGQAPSFTVGNGDVLKTQFVAQIGTVYYYRVWAVGAPGASAGVYTTLNRQPVKHCTVTIG
ncbi:family 16 glycoside hydrolase, partial [Clostridium sp. D33t1_170424_F3]|uniref:family 16 glycoside hydrolase n=1 Tax=Clostridium sp. D33t1_170424_F3 TaxID=2787099 RepID=UPI0018AAF4B3